MLGIFSVIMYWLMFIFYNSNVNESKTKYSLAKCKPIIHLTFMFMTGISCLMHVKLIFT